MKVISSINGAGECRSRKLNNNDRGHLPALTQIRCSPSPAYWTIVTKRLLIILVNTDPRNVEELGAPFYYAAVAAAMDYEVDVLCTATAGKLMFSGVAEKLTIKQGDPMTVYGWIKEAHGQGARFWA